MYENILLPNLDLQKRASIKTAMALGGNQLILYTTLACYFWAGAEIIVYYKGAIAAKDVFSVIFVLMNGTMGAAGAAA